VLERPAAEIHPVLLGTPKFLVLGQAKGLELRDARVHRLFHHGALPGRRRTVRGACRHLLYLFGVSPLAITHRLMGPRAKNSKSECQNSTSE